MPTQVLAFACCRRGCGGGAHTYYCTSCKQTHTLSHHPALVCRTCLGTKQLRVYGKARTMTVACPTCRIRQEAARQ